MRKILLIPTLTTAALMPLISFSACNNGKIDLDPVEFKTCSWSVIAERCNLLENGKISEKQFCNSFLVDKNLSNNEIAPAESLLDFVNQTRETTINNNTLSVVVVGAKQDYLQYTQQSGFTKPAILTFQFDNLISDNDGNSLSIDWDENTDEFGSWSKHYWKSDIHNALEGTNPVKWHNHNSQESTITVSVLDMLEPDIKNNLKTIYRTVNEYEDDLNGMWIQKTRSTKIFLPVLSDLFSTVGLTNSDYSGLLLDGDLELYLKENVRMGHNESQFENNGQYEYYRQRIEDGPIADEKSGFYGYDCIPKRQVAPDPDNTYIRHWLASPKFSDYQFSQSHVYNEAWVCYDYSFSMFSIPLVHMHNVYSVAPCFCF